MGMAQRRAARRPLVIASAPLVEHLLLLPPAPARVDTAPISPRPRPPPPPPPTAPLPAPHRSPPHRPTAPSHPRSTVFHTDLSWSDGGVGEAVASKVEEYEMEFNKVRPPGSGGGAGRGGLRGGGGGQGEGQSTRT
jgi:hypothetical protein